MLYDMDFLKKGATFPPPEEYERIKLYDENRLLFKGEHKQIFRERYNQLFDIDELTVWQFDFNWYRRISTAFANLLFGEPPVITVGGATEQTFLNTILDNSDFINTGYNAVIDISRYGSGIFKPVLEDNTVKIDSLSPGYWFPVFDPKNRKKIIAHYIVWDVDDRLYVEIHDTRNPGIITYQTYQFKNGLIGDLIDFAETETNVKSPLIVVCNNLTTSENGFGIDDYSIIDTIVCELEVRFSQVARILDKHASPSMYGPRSLIQQDKRTGKAVVDVAGKYVGVSPGDTPPNYLVWDAQLSAVNQEIDNLMTQLYALSETSPALFGDLKQGLAESGSALRRLLISPLSKVNRLRLSLDKKIKEVLSLASELAVANSIPNSIQFSPQDIHIDWQDGLPIDMTEQVMVESTAVNSGLSSRESSMKRLWGLEGDALKQEIEKIKAEQSANQPNPPGLKLPSLEEKLNAITINSQVSNAGK